MRAWWAAFAGIVLTVSAGCGAKTYLVVDVSSPLAVPDDVDALRFDVAGAFTGAMLHDQFPLRGGFPQSLVLLPAGNADEQVRITVSGLHGEAGDVVVRRIVAARFVEGEVTHVHVELTAACLSVSCADGVDCVDGRCADGSEPDAGTPDAGEPDAELPDSGMPDVVPTDAGDSGPLDGGMPDAACECDDHDACTTDACGAGGACVHTTRDADGDHHGDSACAAVGGVPADDCDDANPDVFPGAPDVCNGADDDCDGHADQSFTCVRGENGSCATSCGTMGTRVCGPTCAWGVCSPPAEMCNGVDDDCNGECDDGVGCCRGASTTCRTSCGSSGTTMCSDTCAPGSCMPPAETCNGADDDCDGAVDDGFACAAGNITPCTTSCGSIGTQTCGADCTAGSCAPPPESCGNGVDDDCDTMIDEGCTPGCTSTCADAVAVTGTGGRFTHALAADTDHGSCGGTDGSEVHYTFTTTVASDVFVTTHGSGLDTVVYVRGCTCDGTELGCNDDADGQPTSALQLVNLPGGTYTVFIDTKAAMSASVAFDLYVTPTGAAGDRCGRPLRFTGPTQSGSTCGNTSDDVGDCEYAASLDGPDRVYYLVVTAASSVTLDTCTGCTTYDSSLDLRRICNTLGMTDRVMCEDDTCKSSCAGSGPPRQSRVSGSLTPGVYYVFVDGYGSACGDFVLTGSGI